MQAYTHGGNVFSNDVRLDFSVNINPFGMPELVKQAIVSHTSDYESYPDPYCRKLRTAIAQKESVAVENILCGNGAADLIYRLCMSQRSSRVLVCAPAFTDYARAALLSGANIIEHTLHSEDGFALTEAICEDISPNVGMLFLCNPNNPTGRLVEYDLIERILRRCEETGTIAVVDECFLPFTIGKSVVPQISTYASLIVIRAFTKIYAMAGLRLGYMLSDNAELLERIGNFGQCWNVSSVAQIAGLAALRCSDEEQQVRLFIQSERDNLLKALEDIGFQAYATDANFSSQQLGDSGFQTYPTDANFLLLRSSIPLYEPLLKQGIMIRWCPDFSGLDENYYRIAVKLHDQNEILVSALSEILNG